MAEDESIPSTIGRYAVKRLLGAGAMGSVFLAEDPNIKRRIAIKMVKKGLLLNDADRHEVYARFQREAEVSGLLNHPAIVAIYDFGESEAGTYLAMEYVEGRPLDAIVKAGEQLSIAERFAILNGIGEALDHAHTKGIVHRDVKPGNVMIGLDGRPKLMDFGIAKRQDATLTQTGTFLGTPSYASPEQIREGVVDNRSDIFSFGIMAFELFAGRTPFPGTSINTILYKIVNEPPAMPDPPMDGVLPDAWKRIFEKVLAKRPQDRYDSCVLFLQDLRQAFLGMEAGARTMVEHSIRTGTVPSLTDVSIDPFSHNPDATVSTKRSQGRSWPVLALVGLGLVVLVGAGIFLQRQRKAPQVQAEVKPEPASKEPIPAAPAPVAPAPPSKGLLKLVGPYGVKVKLDGEDQGECPSGKTFEVTPGEHQLELSNPKVFFREVREVTAKGGETVVVNLPQLAAVSVYTFPGSGLVSIDGQPTKLESVGEKTLPVAHGRHTFGIQGRPVKHQALIQGDGQVKFGGVANQ